MKISIITPTYNSEKTIARTIESIRAQDYQNLEYIIIDGQSSDHTLSIIKEYQKKYPIKLISEPDPNLSHYTYINMRNLMHLRDHHYHKPQQ